MGIKEFVANNDIDQSNGTINVSMIEQAEKAVGVHFGEELTEYLLKYGYLGFEYVEFFGMNPRQGLKSDLIEQTLYMHKYFPATSDLIAIENQGEGDYYLIDSEDIVYEYDTSLKQLRKTDIKLFEHIMERFESVG